MPNSDPAARNDYIAMAQSAIDVELQGIANLREALSGPTLGPAFIQAVEVIRQSTGRIIVTGVGKSGQIGRKIAATLASTGTPAYFVHAAEASHGDLGMIQQGDTILALSWSGGSAEFKVLVSYAERFGIPLIAVTSRPDSLLGAGATICLTLPVSEEACPNNLAPTTSTTMQLVLGDALAVALLKARGFTAGDFAIFHPGGKLGAQLKPLSDFMRPMQDVPAVRSDVTVGEALIQMSRFGLGFTLVLHADGNLAGIITDGDFRRHMRPDIAGLPVSAIMTPTPKVLQPDMLAAEALGALLRQGVTAAPIVADGKLIGGIHLMDFVRLGMI